MNNTTQWLILRHKQEAMRLGAAAAACLTHPSTTDGMLKFDRVMELSRHFPEQPAPVRV